MFRSLARRLRARLRARPQARIEVLFWLVLAAFLGYRVWPQMAAAFGLSATDAVAPDFHLTTLDGRPVSRDALRGQVVLLNFWATWCPPCRVEMPGFQRVYDRRRADGFTILGVSTDATGEAPVARWLVDHGITYPVAMVAGSIARDFGGVSALPTSILLDRRGRIRHRVEGLFTEVALDQAVGRLLAEPATDPAPATGPAATASTTPAGGAR